ncbi:hypothetical protein L1D34_28685 [Vibrio mediterranei]|jgi:hypothetical protein|uniref:hypothetical protein n=1 Tax=Vibrio mediterranei TaxID=689 RepID=UPI00125F71D5|nr:hypothetical protein [Vibrio mediterranei]MCG9628787.1 hypothetical protein [Vibrio mediterranei]
MTGKVRCYYPKDEHRSLCARASRDKTERAVCSNVDTLHLKTMGFCSTLEQSDTFKVVLENALLILGNM